jgi:hypothetical protein
VTSPFLRKTFSEIVKLSLLATLLVAYSFVVQSAGNFHGHVGQPWLLVPKHVLDDPTALHPGDGVLYADTKFRQLAVRLLLRSR